MANEVNLDELNLVRSGYERFFNENEDLGDCENAIITIQRKEQITTHFGPLTTKNKIKVSLSQEQIVNGAIGMRSGIKRSQSINIQRTSFSPPQYLRRDRSFNFSQRHSSRPSMIPIKIKEPLKLCAPPNPDQRIVRKLSAPNERPNFVEQQELTLSSLPLPMAQSMDTAFDSGRYRDIRSTLADKFKCGICLHALSDPRVLDCLHTFCLECLYGIENNNNSNNNNNSGNIQVKTNKINLMVQSNSRESNEIDTNSSNHSDAANELKDSGRKVSKTSIASLSTNPIRKIFSAAQKKRTEERKVNGCNFVRLLLHELHRKQFDLLFN